MCPQISDFPTGLFAFQEVTPPDWPSTMPQELRAGDTYLVNGYQGTTVRLLPGKYTVCYQDPIEAKPSECFSAWYVAGPFVGGTSGQGLDAEYPPDKESNHDPQTTYPVGRATVAWRRLCGSNRPAADLTPSRFLCQAARTASKTRDFSSPTATIGRGRKARPYRNSATSWSVIARSKNRTSSMTPVAATSPGRAPIHSGKSLVTSGPAKAPSASFWPST